MKLKLIAGIFFTLVLLSSHWFTYKAGVNKERANDAVIIAKYKKQVTELINVLEKVKGERDEATHNKVVVVKKIKSKCADTAVDQSILDQLQ